MDGTVGFRDGLQVGGSVGVVEVAADGLREGFRQGTEEDDLTVGALDGRTVGPKDGA